MTATDGALGGATLDLLPLRLHPGDDLRRAIEAAVHGAGWPGAFVVAGIGSLSNPRLRLAGQTSEVEFDGDFELVSLSGTVAVNGAHLHMCIADAQGRVSGGHVVYGNAVRTTAEILLAPLPVWQLTRAHDPATGHAELQIRHLPA